MVKNSCSVIKAGYSKYRTFISEFFKDFPKSKKIAFILLNAFLSLYIATTRFLLYSSIFVSNTLTVFAIGLWIFYSIVIFNAIIYLCHIFRDRQIHINAFKSKLNIKTFLVYSSICFAVLGVMLMAYYPGGICEDVCSQWRQVQSFEFNDWHPFPHTLMIWLITRIWNHYPFVLFFQIMVFSLGIGYLVATLEAWGFPKLCLVVVELSVVLNQAIRSFMMFAWKDIALTIFILFILVQCINIYLSDGQWLKKYPNIIAFSVCVALATLVRHNGFFYTFPLLMLIFFVYIKRAPRVLTALLLVVAIMFFVRVPLYKFLNVRDSRNHGQYLNQTYVESVGLAMTIMGDVMTKNPDALSPETKSFLNRMGTDEEWKQLYVHGSFNSIKWKSHAPWVINEVPPKDLLKMTLDTIKADPRNSARAVKELTDMVWETKGDPEAKFDVVIRGDWIGYSYNNTIFNKIGKFFVDMLDTFSDTPFLNWILIMTGVHMLLLMLFGLFSYYKNGMKALIFVVPSVTYNLGTMLWLCGNTYRFFLFNTVITIPICWVLLSRTEIHSI